MRDVRPKLLIVDDGLPIRMSLLSMFTALHYAVRSAPDGFTALAEIRNEVPDLILSELHMPGMSGYELLSIVRRQYPTIRLIAMGITFSGDHAPHEVVADAFYPKDAHPGLVLGIVEGIARRRRSLFHPLLSSARVWIPTHADSEEPYVTITCPGCLRAFPAAAEIIVDFPVIAGCVYCRDPIHHTGFRPSNCAVPVN